MLRGVVIGVGAVMFAVGLAGFFIPNLMYLVQFDLFQSLVYAVAGAVGLQLGVGQTSRLARRRYLDTMAILNLLLLMLGLSFPNLGDVFHLEVPEHVFHAVVGVTTALLASHYRQHQT